MRGSSGQEKSKHNSYTQEGKEERSRNRSSVSFTRTPGKVKEKVILEILSKRVKDKKVISNSWYAILKENQDWLTWQPTIKWFPGQRREEHRILSTLILVRLSALFPYNILMEKLIEVWARWINTWVDWKLIELSVSKIYNQQYEVQLAASH